MAISIAIAVLTLTLAVALAAYAVRLRPSRPAIASAAGVRLRPGMERAHAKVALRAEGNVRRRAAAASQSLDHAGEDAPGKSGKLEEGIHAGSFHFDNIRNNSRSPISQGEFALFRNNRIIRQPIARWTHLARAAGHASPLPPAVPGVAACDDAAARRAAPAPQMHGPP
ncbi:hypothetical protein [Pedomonas mirosovicensis]|uniref:hypothetical protein n=1 Tax=Pedomonas mirosovicensis TaxID=2908641 RepID=UPI002167ED7F|nr:hypothetical protein [Pedomonas mirosovicensis]MCH8686483.1 hypothetical protein [Pedomonas mirosovicensis]